MRKTGLVALTMAFAPVAAHGATVVASPPSPPGADGFSLTGLIDGTDHILMSVDDRPQQSLDAFGSDAIAFAPADIVAKRAAPAAFAKVNYSSADTAPQEPLPEPTTWLMMILGFFGLSFAVRRRSSTTGDRVRFS